ncbi:DUF6890 family protein [Photobacterium arenosum]|uniref:DUF6890 family protein n=1 Tax=Photobacterium arenosum TaxID=2774143 RepID=UPI003AF882A2
MGWRADAGIRAENCHHRKKINSKVTALDNSDLAQLLAFRRKWLPGEPDDENSLAQAAWLEKRYWENMAAVMASGVSKAFSG